MPSKLNDDPFISFIEATIDSEDTLTATAYIVVVDVRGERGLGGDLATTLVPNRSIYLGGNLMIKINEDETYL